MSDDFRTTGRFLGNLLLLAGSTLTALLLAEGGLRLAGYQPWIAKASENHASSIQFHPQRGWELKAGIFARPSNARKGSGTADTYMQLPGGLRRSYAQQDGTLSSKLKLIMVGGSYTHGSAIADDETFSWKLQRKLPGLEVLNYGVGGYGTLQSLMKLQQILPTIPQRKLVVYGLITHHLIRNVSTPSWISTLSGRTRNDLHIPYVKRDLKRRIQRQPLLHFSPFPLREYSALIALLESTWISIRWRTHNDERMTPITISLVSDMRKLSKEYGADFLVVLLSVDTTVAKVYTKIFSRSGIKALNCSSPLTADMIVTGERYPNDRMNTRWARCIGNYLDAHPDLLPEKKGG